MATNNKFFLGKKAGSEIEQFEELIRKNPEDDRAYVRLAELYARAGRETKAIETYEKVAVIFEKKGFLNKAKAVLKQALLLSPEHGKINVLLADYDKQSGLVKDAAMRYNTAVNYYVKNGNKATVKVYADPAINAVFAYGGETTAFSGDAIFEVEI